MIWRLKRLLDWFAKQVQRVCPHRTLTWVADAWDAEYRCGFCNKIWFNEIPKLRRRFTDNVGRWWVLDGKGGVAEE